MANLAGKTVVVKVYTLTYCNRSSPRLRNPNLTKPMLEFASLSSMLPLHLVKWTSCRADAESWGGVVLFATIAFRCDIFRRITILSSPTVPTRWLRLPPPLISTHNGELAAASQTPTSVLGAASPCSRYELDKFRPSSKKKYRRRLFLENDF